MVQEEFVESAAEIKVGSIVTLVNDGLSMTKMSEEYVGIVTDAQDNNNFAVAGVYSVGQNGTETDYDRCSGKYRIHGAFMTPFHPSLKDYEKYMGFLRRSMELRVNPKTVPNTIKLIEAKIKELETTGKTEDTSWTRGIYVPVAQQDAALIEEMIGQVDLRRLRNLLSLAGSSESNRRNCSQEVVDKYVQAWAHAKYGIWLAFGRKLTISKEIDIEISVEEMEGLRNAFIRQFAKHAPVLCYFNSVEFLQNRVGNHREFIEYIPEYKSGMNLTRFLSNYLNDKELDVELSKLMQAKTIKGHISLSIDPYDYLTTSINQHNWHSCHRIGGGQYGNGSVAYMVDESTIVGFKDNGRTYSYTVNGFKFEGNSKAMRQLVHMDQHTCAAIFSRIYPDERATGQAGEELCEALRSLYRHAMSNYTSSPCQWTKSDQFKGETDRGSYPYIDYLNGRSYVYIKPKNWTGRKPKMVVAKNDIYCVYCGKSMGTGGGRNRTNCGDCHA